jgi:uncharacterized 2Fe-2S/4Fe-4S cluster protein (DUF4445 family)
MIYKTEMRHFMDILKDIAVDIDENRIAAMLKCGQNQQEDMHALIRQQIKVCLPILKPQITLEKVNIKGIEGDRVYLENGIVFKGAYITQKLACCRYIVASVCTAGQEIDDYISKCFDDGDGLAGMAEDCIVVSALENLGNILWNRLVEQISGTNLGITPRLSPGDDGWELSDQRELFKCFSEKDKIGVTLSSSGMMLPLKSASAVYGFGEGIGIARSDHVCSECSLKKCLYRVPEEYDILVNTGDIITAIKAKHGDNLLKILQKNKMISDFPCAGNGICGKCRVRIVSGITEPSPEDKTHLTPEELAGGFRLACCVTVCAPLAISVQTSAFNVGYEIMTEGIQRHIEISSPVTKKHLTLKKTGVDDRRSDLRRISDGMGINDMSADLALLRNLSEKTMAANFDFTAAAYNNTLISIENGDTQGRKFGVAADIGTTTVVCYLVDLNNGRVADIEARVNSQSAHGADVISRIGFTIDNARGTETLRDLIIMQVNSMVGCLCDRNDINPQQIYNMAVTGNTIMLHFFLGLPSKNIAAAPFTPVTTAAADFSAKELGIEINGVVSVMPGIAGYVGSDITAGILACGMMESESYSLLIDLGTNGEMALGNSRGVTACAVAAGPAFEGGNIKYGVGGIQGAICRVELEKANICETIGGDDACGICGSGVLDVVSELLKHGVIDETGRMASKESIGDAALRARLGEDGGVRQFILERNTALGYPITFTQKDIREVQLAKAAVAAGICVLLKETGTALENIEKVYIAGGFGNFMNMESALNIGLIPQEFKGKTVSAGNTAGMGAKLYLLSNVYRQKAVQIAEFATYIELSNKAEFQDLYVDAMTFE